MFYLQFSNITFLVSSHFLMINVNLRLNQVSLITSQLNDKNSFLVIFPILRLSHQEAENCKKRSSISSQIDAEKITVNHRNASITGLRWSLRVFPGCQDSYDLGECHRLYGLGRHKEPP